MSLEVVEKNQNKIDSVQYFLNGQELKDLPADISQMKLGKQALTATVYFDGEKKILTNTVYFMAAHPPLIYNYEIVKEFPHDQLAFTQGFEYHDGYIYESTGQYGQSSLRKVELETGKVLEKVIVDKQYFAEGLTIKNDKIYQLTWQKGIGFVYDLATLKVIDTFKYNQSKEGWGLTHNNDQLIKSDGTERIWFLDSNDLSEKSFIEAYTDQRKAEKLNELEFVKGKIYANIWQQNSILIIDPEKGAIEGIANLKGLQNEAGQQGDDNVLNGIAYDEANDRLFVTGKKWNKVFEIKLVKK
ncbi:glutaminyl-peptide cyclotransferase [Namhaeicola litoreus]|uniref:glutaminyl-peptide cyclotransferase n=1 Tax=Namhaeicola litoreus TaxID=1052145 RepID=UPI0036731448